jgi:putative ABC transport system permease protein
MTALAIAARQHLRQRGFASAVVATIGLAVGATTAVFSIVNAVLVRGLPVADPDRVVWVSSIRRDNPNGPFTLPEYIDYRARTRTLAGLAAYGNWSASVEPPRDATAASPERGAGDGVAERLTGARMSGNAFAVVGVAPAAGRLLREADDEPGADRVVVLSYRFWQRRFGGATEAIGATVRINGGPYTVVGIMPPHVPLPLLDIDVATALQPDTDPLRHLRNSVNFLRFIGRLADGVTREQSQSELTTICRSLREQFPAEYARKEAVRVMPLHEIIVGDHRPALLVLMGAVIVVLGMAAANLLSIALVRATGRHHELATRVAMGASRRHLLLQLSMEMGLLAAAGIAAGLIVASQAVAAARAFGPAGVPRLAEVTLDATVVAFAVISTLAVAALLTLAPLALLARADGADVLRASRGSAGDAWSHRIRHGLVIFEIASALVLLLATMSLVQGLRHLGVVPLGFDPDPVFQARVSLPSTYRSPDDVSRFADRLSEQLRAAPGVQQVGVISVAPLSGLIRSVPFTVEGQAEERGGTMANLRAISPAYLAAVGMRLNDGRGVSDDDRANGPPVALVSAALADRFFAAAAVGRRLMINDNNTGPRPVQIVGVVDNTRHVSLDAPAELDIYVPLRQIHPDGMTAVRDNHFWMVRTHSAPGRFRATFVEHLRRLDPDVAMSGGGSMRESIGAWLAPRRFTLGLFAAFALSAILLAATGLYGLVAYAVQQRRREIGVRIAIGATARDVVWLVVRQAVTLAAIGAVIGAWLAQASQRVIAGMTPVRLDPATIAAAVALLMSLVLVAAWLPARRAARIDPAETLRM